MSSQKSQHWAKKPEILEAFFNKNDPKRVPIRERFLNADFKYDDPKSRVHPLHEKPGKTKSGACRHFEAFPLLTVKSCSHCGLRHSDKQDCAIYRFHNKDALYQMDEPVLREFPCGYCNSYRHTTPMCGVLHGYCKTCQTRGHLPYKNNGHMSKKKGQTGKCHIKAEVFLLHKRRFAQLAHLGRHTSKPNSAWSYAPPLDHECEKNHFSDSEDEN